MRQTTGTERVELSPELVSIATPVASFTALFWLLATGRLVTRRENETNIAGREKAEATRDSLIAQNHELMEMARLGQNTFVALRQAADQAAKK